MKTPPSQLVVGFDFTFSGRVALDRAIAFAVRTPAHVLHLVCAIDPHMAVPSIPAPDGINYQYAERVQQALTWEVERVLRDAAITEPVHFYVHARIGHPAEEILAVARDVGADTIIVGSKNTTGVARFVLGSVSERVAREAGCTVEIARPKTYDHVNLLTVIENTAPHHPYVAPHRYSYEDRRLNMRPAEWPLY